MTLKTACEATTDRDAAVLYARVSSKDQEREGFSIPAQQKLLREYAEHQQPDHRRASSSTSRPPSRRAAAGSARCSRFSRVNPTCRTILVEKTDRLYRNIKDWITVDELDLAVHFVKEGAVISKASRSSDKFMHGIKVLMAKNYVRQPERRGQEGARREGGTGPLADAWRTLATSTTATTRRIDVDPVRGPLVARVFELYATGEVVAARPSRGRRTRSGLRHWRGDRRMTKSEIHRMLSNPIYTGDFVWLGKRYRGSHEPLITPARRSTRSRPSSGGKPRARYVEQRHAFMGLLTCARCGCAMTAEMKKGKYVYYRCTGFRGAAATVYIREEAARGAAGHDLSRFRFRRRSLTTSPRHCETTRWRGGAGTRRSPTAARGSPTQGARQARSRVRRLSGGTDHRGLLDPEVRGLGGGAPTLEGELARLGTVRRRSSR